MELIAKLKVDTYYPGETLEDLHTRLRPLGFKIEPNSKRGGVQDVNTDQSLSSQTPEDSVIVPLQVFN